MGAVIEISISLYDEQIRVGHGPMGKAIGDVDVTPRGTHDRFITGHLNVQALREVLEEA